MLHATQFLVRHDVGRSAAREGQPCEHRNVPFLIFFSLASRELGISRCRLGFFAGPLFVCSFSQTQRWLEPLSQMRAISSVLATGASRSLSFLAPVSWMPGSLAPWIRVCQVCSGPDRCDGRVPFTSGKVDFVLVLGEKQRGVVECVSALPSLSCVKFFRGGLCGEVLCGGNGVWECS